MEDRKHEMTVAKSAEQWDRAMPTGNGRIGALIFGNIPHETILLNHDSLFIRSEKPVLPDVSQYVLVMRQMIAEGRYDEAKSFFQSKIDENYEYRGPDSFHPAFDIIIDMPGANQITNERRHVNFETGEVSVSWDQERVAYERKVFVSRSDDAVVIQIHASKPGMVNCRVGLLPTGLRNAELGDGKNVRISRFPMSRTSPKIKLDEVPITFNLSTAQGFIDLLATYDTGGSYCMVGGEYGGCAGVVVKGGNATTSELQVSAENADEVLVLVKLFANEESNVAVNRIHSQLERLPQNYSELLERHAKLHRELFLRVRLDLGGQYDFRGLSNEELMDKCQQKQGLNAMMERLFDFGRYALICSSGSEGMPANLQGIWNGEYGPAWASDYHTDINVQMNYFQVLPGNMAELSLPYFDLYESLLEDNHTNAQNTYGSRGILVSICGGTTHGLMYGSAFTSWTAGAGWLAQLFYDYWLYTGDRDFLERRAVPYMKEVALFYEDFLTEGPDGKYIFSPSMSPENTPQGQKVHWAVNATMDVAVARELLSNLCTACDLLGIEEAGVRRWREMITKLPNYEVNEVGALKEWLHPELHNNDSHRHLSHFYPVFPGWEITRERNPEFFQACRVALKEKMRKMGHPCTWTYAQAATTYARLEQGELAGAALEAITGKGHLLPNLLTTLYENNPLMQFEATSGIPAAIMEMLVFSEPGLIKLLPALPKNWSVGSVRGIRTRGGFEVDIEWKEGKLTQAVIRSLLGNTCKVQYRDKVIGECDPLLQSSSQSLI